MRGKGPGSHRGAASVKKHKFINKSKKQPVQLIDKLRNHFEDVRKDLDSKLTVGFLACTSRYLTCNDLAKEFKVNLGEVVVCVTQLHHKEGICSAISKRRMSFYVYASEGVTKQANEVEPLIQMFNFSHCPVCNNELKIDVTESWNKKIVNGMQYSCKSKCFEYSVIRNREHKVTIFNNKFEAPYEPKAIVEQVRNDVNRKINHFKRKNRYIAEILLR